MYDERGGSVRLTLANVPRLDSALAARLPEGAEHVLDIIRAADTPQGTGDIADAAGVTRPTAKRRLDALQREGLVRWVGRSPKDPRAHWVLTGTA
jgi:ATP-dependent DNA helicase RecG